MTKLVKAPTPNRRLSANDGKLYVFNGDCLCELPDEVAKSLPGTYKIIKDVSVKIEKEENLAQPKMEKIQEPKKATETKKGKLPKSKKSNS